MTEPTREEIQELWGKCGIPKDPPVVDLNNLFKYAVPLLKGISIERNYSIENSPLFEVTVCLDKLWESAVDKDPTIALFRACQQVFKEVASGNV